jgi:small subunit ribosomal protein S9
MEVYLGTGRRKNAIARVRLTPGDGKVVVNGKDLLEHFRRETLKMDIEQPFEVTETLGKFDLKATVVGGGLSGQAGAVRLGIARALLTFSEDFRSVLRRGGFLTRDPREKERRKYGFAKARKRYQFSKR